MDISPSPVASAAAKPPATFLDAITSADRQLGYSLMGYSDPELWPGDMPRLVKAAGAAQQHLQEALRMDAPAESLDQALKGLQLVGLGIDLADSNETAAISAFDEATKLLWRLRRDAGRQS